MGDYRILTVVDHSVSPAVEFNVEVPADISFKQLRETLRNVGIV